MFKKFLLTICLITGCFGMMPKDQPDTMHGVGPTQLLRVTYQLPVEKSWFCPKRNQEESRYFFMLGSQHVYPGAKVPTVVFDELNNLDGIWSENGPDIFDYENRISETLYDLNPVERFDTQRRSYRHSPVIKTLFSEIQEDFHFKDPIESLPPEIVVKILAFSPCAQGVDGTIIHKGKNIYRLDKGSRAPVDWLEPYKMLRKAIKNEKNQSTVDAINNI